MPEPAADTPYQHILPGKQKTEEAASYDRTIKWIGDGKNISWGPEGYEHKNTDGKIPGGNRVIVRGDTKYTLEKA